MAWYRYDRYDVLQMAEMSVNWAWSKWLLVLVSLQCGPPDSAGDHMWFGPAGGGGGLPAGGGDCFLDKLWGVLTAFADQHHQYWHVGNEIFRWVESAILTVGIYWRADLVEVLESCYWQRYWRILTGCYWQWALLMADDLSRWMVAAVVFDFYSIYRKVDVPCDCTRAWVPVSFVFVFVCTVRTTAYIWAKNLSKVTYKF